MSFHSRIALPATIPSTRTVKVGPCFRTDAEGRIALDSDWSKLFTEARRFDALALQTRHAYVRLIHLGRVPEFTWSAEGAFASQPTGSLRLNPIHWVRAIGRLAECSCCGTPGRMEILNQHGLDFLQLCALPDCAPNQWADYLLDVSARQPAPEYGEKIPVGAFPMPPETSISVCEEAADEILADLLAALADAALPFTARLQTPEVTHVRELNPQRIFIHAGILTLQAGDSTLQIGFPAVRSLGLHLSKIHGPQLHVLGVGDALLLTLSAHSEAAGAARWLAALRATFPQHV